ADPVSPAPIAASALCELMPPPSSLSAWSGVSSMALPGSDRPAAARGPRPESRPTRNRVSTQRFRSSTSTPDALPGLLSTLLQSIADGKGVGRKWSVTHAGPGRRRTGSAAADGAVDQVHEDLFQPPAVPLGELVD